MHVFATEQLLDAGHIVFVHALGDESRQQVAGRTEWALGVGLQGSRARHLFLQKKY
jgi:hypothetical protein